MQDNMPLILLLGLFILLLVIVFTGERILRGLAKQDAWGAFLEKSKGAALLAVGGLVFLACLVVMYFSLALTPRNWAFFGNACVVGFFSGIVVFKGWRSFRDEGDGEGIDCGGYDFHEPEFQEALRKARQTLPGFLERLKADVDGAQVLFVLPEIIDEEDKDKSGGPARDEHVWGQVLAYREGKIFVSFREYPEQRDDELAHKELAESAVKDWQIIQPDGRVKGAFSHVAVVRYLVRQGKRLNATLKRKRDRLIDF